MRRLWIVSLSTVALMISAAGLVGQPAANVASTAEFRQPSIMIDQLTANAKNLPVQSFDAF